jgi:uncharacterized membrane protein YesL
MSNTKDFQDRPMNRTFNYIHWFFITNLFFFLCNAPILLVLYTLNISISNILIFFVALIPTGPSLTALYSCMNKIHRDKYLDTTRDFFKGYKENFFVSMKLWLLLLIPTFIIIFDINLCLTNNNFSYLLIPLIFLFVLILSLGSYSFPLLSKYQIKLVDLLKLSIYLLFKNIMNTIINLIIIFVSAYLFFNSNGIISIFLFSAACYASLFNMKKAFMFVENKFLR